MNEQICNKIETVDSEVIVLGTYHLVETQRKTQNLLKGLRFLAGLRIPWDSTKELARVTGKREIWVSLLRLLPLQPTPNKRKTMGQLKHGSSIQRMYNLMFQMFYDCFMLDHLHLVEARIISNNLKQSPFVSLSSRNMVHQFSGVCSVIMAFVFTTEKMFNCFYFSSFSCIDEI